MLKILGRSNSINVMKVLWACEELHLPYERVDVGGAFGFKHRPDYLSLNPNALVPTIDDDGFLLWESNVIVRYLSAKHGMGSLFPKDERTRWNAERWMDWQQTTVGAAMTAAIVGLLRTPPAQRNGAAIEASRKASAEAMNILDKHLATSAFVAGDTFTMADIPLGCSAYRWFALPLERPSQPHLAAWQERLQQRPGYRKHLTLPMT
jgi:glutathione S-transferase